MKKDFVISGVILFLGGLLLFFSTNGFTAFTMEAQRLQDLKDRPPEFPNIEVVDNKGRKYDFDEFEGKHMLMTFIYTSCATACPEMSSNMKYVYDMIDPALYEDDLVFLSVSFDTERDTVEVLDRYAGYFEADGGSWRMLRVPDEDDLEDILDMYGVTVIPEGDADYQHNTSFYLIEPDGRLGEVLDYREVGQAVETIEAAVAEDAEVSAR
ncbi:SCO family protein [Lacicoccus alkaliphilus]|uniref:Protein SCO1/2 n=1 Tax=Lacicoccus alkaliphilus DSM 16010 TaxID=1123231 RepID=A0A1M7G674_9BACL|nr:SCO family protein [Salinicoccus alkaliphilus]SHM11645.1 protein SCO1/2 [Salinicoccus alkaliphilus DSM 16010]